MRRIWTVGVLSMVIAVVSAGGAQAADKTFKVNSGQRLDWQGQSAQGVSNYYYWDPVGAGNTGPFTHTTCNKERTTYCEQVLVELANPLTAAEIESGVESKIHAVTVWLDAFSQPRGPVNDFDLLVYASDAAGTRGELLDSDGNLQNTTVELVSFDVVTTPTEPSKFILIDVVYYQVVNGSFRGHITF